jgi:hypothetical protein
MIRNTIVPLFSAFTLLAALSPASASDFRPASCRGTITTGPQSAEVVCTQVSIGTYNDDTSAVTFFIRDTTGATGLIRAAIESTDVERAAASNNGGSFPIKAFFIHELDNRKHSPRWALDGTCTVSTSRIACGANDAVGGFTIAAEL